MTITLNLGVNDIPYSVRAPVQRVAKPLKGKRAKLRKPAKVLSGHATTGDVAQWLENKYGVMGYFFERHEADIVKAVEESLAGSIETMLMGGRSGSDPFAGGMSRIEQAFRQFLDQREMDGRPGVPTEAAQRGINHRLKRANVRRAPRPSFIDTGTYSANFRAWVEAR